MLELRTEFATFGNFRDRTKFMEDEGISKATVEAYYIFDKVIKLPFTLVEIKEKLASGELF